MEKIYDLENKNKAIVIFKFFAALLITYYHISILFPNYPKILVSSLHYDILCHNILYT